MRGLVELLAGAADNRIRLWIGSVLVLALTGSVLAGVAPLALKYLVDSLTRADSPDLSGERTATALLSGVGYVLALAAARILTEIRLLYAGRAEQHLHARLSHRYLDHLLALPLGFHLSRPTGALTNSLSQAAAGCQMGLNSLLQCLPVITELATVLVVLAHVGEPGLAAIFAASTLAYAFVFASGARRVRVHGRSVAQAGLQLHGTLADGLINVEAVKCFNASATMLDRFASNTRTLVREWTGLHRQRAATGLAAAAVFVASVGASLFVAGQAVAAGRLTIGGFVLATVCMLQMVRPLELLGSAARDLVQAMEFARPLLEVMQTAPEASHESRPARNLAPGPQRWPDETPACPPVLDFQDVHFDYGDGRPVLQGLDLHVPAGSTLAIVGGSGAGKSSIVRLLLRLHDTTSGRILWNGLPIEQLDIGTLRSRIAMVPQDTTLLDDTIAANIAIGRPGASRTEIEEAARRARLDVFVASLPEGYDTRVGGRGLKLSGGERQRMAIARAVIRCPQVYVFDEVTSMLDGRTETAVMESLREIAAGCTTIFVTHRLAAARAADQIVVLHEGRVAERGRHAELMSRGGIYRDLWRARLTSRPAPASPAARAGTTKARTRASLPFVRRPAWHRRTS